MIWSEMSQVWINMISGELNEEKNLLPVCCVGRNDRDFIRGIVSGFRLF